LPYQLTIVKAIQMDIVMYIVIDIVMTIVILIVIPNVMDIALNNAIFIVIAEATVLLSLLRINCKVRYIRIIYNKQFSKIIKARYDEYANVTNNLTISVASGT
jgi:hypothetical protein